MSRDVAPNYGTMSGYSLQAVRASYTKHERVISTPGFYMRETYIHAEIAQINVSPVQGIEAKVQQPQMPQIIDADASIVNRIAPKEKPKIYDQRQVGYLKPRSVSGKPESNSRITPTCYSDQIKDKLVGLKNCTLKGEVLDSCNFLIKTKPLYEMLGSNLPNDFYLTAKDMQLTYGKPEEAGLENDRVSRYKSLEKPMNSHACKRCGVPVMLGRVCNNCIASLN